MAGIAHKDRRTSPQAERLRNVEPRTIDDIPVMDGRRFVEDAKPRHCAEPSRAVRVHGSEPIDETD
jgi:hypothetical protein